MENMANRLVDSTSPYLVQHADNPVDWWEWGPEALAVAKELDRPILLSVGYAACHWCHEIERPLERNSRHRKLLLTRPFRTVAVRPGTMLDADSAASCITFVYHSGVSDGLEQDPDTTAKPLLRRRRTASNSSLTTTLAPRRLAAIRRMRPGVEAAACASARCIATPRARPGVSIACLMRRASHEFVSRSGLVVRPA